MGSDGTGEMVEESIEFPLVLELLATWAEEAPPDLGLHAT